MVNVHMLLIYLKSLFMFYPVDFSRGAWLFTYMERNFGLS